MELVREHAPAWDRPGGAGVAAAAAAAAAVHTDKEEEEGDEEEDDEDDDAHDPTDLAQRTMGVGVSVPVYERAAVQYVGYPPPLCVVRVDRSAALALTP
jgi:hypothetical protein